MKIQIPRTLDLLGTLNFCNIIDGLQEDENYIYDYENMTMIEPFGMLLLGSKVRNFVSLKEESSHSDCNFKDSRCAKYAAHMGFFYSVHQNFGNKPGQAKGSDTYIPITNHNIENLKLEAKKNKIDIYEYIENISNSMARILSRSKDENLIKFLSFGIRELLRNVYEHSKSNELWYAGQYWPSKDLVEVAILDEGIGIKKSFQNNKKIRADNDEDAIRLALKPGISRSGINKLSKGIYDNEGFGLYMISSICKTAGDFAVCSGSKCLLTNSKETNLYETSFNGTAIRMRIKPSKLGKIQDIMSNISREGSTEAKRYKELNIISS